MSWARVGIFLGEAARERKRLHSVAETLGLPVFGSDSLRALRALKPDATTAFILGTGASAADLTDQKIEYIQSQFSIGVNQWLLHPMIPDVYSYEVDPDVRLLQALDRPEVRGTTAQLLILKPSRADDYLNVRHLPQFMRERAYVYGRVNIWTRSKHNIRQDFRDVTSVLSRLRNPAVLLDDGASVARMITLCKLLRFRRVVLVGVDLNNVEYFWHRRPEYLSRLGIDSLETFQKGDVHETLSDSGRPFPIDEFVAGISSASSGNLQVLVESPKSLLAPLVGVWHFQNA